MKIVHQCGELEDLVQECTRCGRIITDYRDCMVESGSPALNGFPVGPVTVFGRHTVTGADEDAVSCVPVH